MSIIELLNDPTIADRLKDVIAVIIIVAVLCGGGAIAYEGLRAGRPPRFWRART